MSFTTGLIDTLAQLLAWKFLLLLSMTWRWRYLTQITFLSTASLTWPLELHLLFCFSQEKALRWKKTSTHTHTHTCTRARARAHTHTHRQIKLLHACVSFLGTYYKNALQQVLCKLWFIYYLSSCKSFEKYWFKTLFT